MNVARTLRIVPTGTHLGADIFGLDLTKPLDEETMHAVEDAWHRHSVVVLKNQIISDQQHVDFSRRFGPLTDIPILAQYQLPHLPQIFVVSNIIEDGKPVGLGDAGRFWHTDGSTYERPFRGSLLRALEVPHDDTGQPLGDTLFASTAVAYDALPEAMKARLVTLKATHRYKRYDTSEKTAAGVTNAGAARAALSADQQKIVRDRVHPVVRVHPYTGRKCLYVNEYFTVGIVGMEAAESDALLQELYDHITQPKFVYRHRWSVGDIVIWDNCSLQHLAIADYALPQRRRMHRTTLAGTLVFGAQEP